MAENIHIVVDRFNMFRSCFVVPSLSDSVMCYGPAVPDGYGVCYNIYEDCFNVSISSYFTSPQTSSVIFGEHLVRTLAEFKELLEKR